MDRRGGRGEGRGMEGRRGEGGEGREGRLTIWCGTCPTATCEPIIQWNLSMMVTVLGSHLSKTASLPGLK